VELDVVLLLCFFHLSDNVEIVFFGHRYFGHRAVNFVFQKVFEAPLSQVVNDFALLLLAKRILFVHRADGNVGVIKLGQFLRPVNNDLVGNFLLAVAPKDSPGRLGPNVAHELLHVPVKTHVYFVEAHNVADMQNVRQFAPFVCEQLERGKGLRSVAVGLRALHVKRGVDQAHTHGWLALVVGCSAVYNHAIDIVGFGVADRALAQRCKNHFLVGLKLERRVSQVLGLLFCFVPALTSIGKHFVHNKIKF
jgi:hypothetical protein